MGNKNREKKRLRTTTKLNGMNKNHVGFLKMFFKTVFYTKNPEKLAIPFRMKSEISFDCVFKWFRCTNSIKSCIQDIIYDKPICGFLSSVYHLLINSSMLMITLITIHSLFIAQIIGIKTEFMRRWIPLQLLPNIDKCSMDFYSTLIRSIKLNECYR